MSVRTVGLETDAFRVLNRIIEPAVRAGWGSPGIVSVGLIVLETKGWRSGRWHRTPQVAHAIGDHLLVSTVRGRRSHWVQNLRRSAEVRYWRNGRRYGARAMLFAPDEEPPDVGELPPVLRLLGPGIICLASDLGCATAILSGRAPI